MKLPHRPKHIPLPPLILLLDIGPQVVHQPESLSRRDQISHRQGADSRLADEAHGRDLKRGTRRDARFGPSLEQIAGLPGEGGEADVDVCYEGSGGVCYRQEGDEAAEED